MKKLALSVIFFVLFNPAVLSARPSESGYAGAEVCMGCHQKEYDQWKTSGHARIIHKPDEQGIEAIPLPAGFNRQNASYVIGGYRWKALFLDQNGYLITSTTAGQGKNQYNLKTKTWVDYFTGQKIPYNCGGCHTTGFSTEGRQNGLEGVMGTWKFEGVQCEVCHGPGALHAQSSLKTDIKTDRNICSHCHGTKPLDVIPLQGVFLAPYTEANQLMKNSMRTFTCIVCHNPHLPADKSIKRSCESCHQKTAAEYKGSYMYKLGVKCIDCHMPPAGIIAEGDAKTFDGDFKSHLFKIDHRREFPVIAKNGQRMNPGYLSVDYACMRCHSLYHNRQWAESTAMFAHKIKITTDIKIMRLQVVFAYIGFVLSLIALLSALSLKNWLLPKANKKKMLTIHRFAAWISFAVYIFISTMCIYFHTPLNNLSEMSNLGWFLIHPINGVIGLILYGGKIITVRKYKAGWKTPGLLWGVAISIFWLIQVLTVLFHFQIF